MIETSAMIASSHKKARVFADALRNQLTNYQDRHGVLVGENKARLEHVAQVGSYVTLVTSPHRAMYIWSSAIAEDWADKWPPSCVHMTWRDDLGTVSDEVYGEGETCLLQMSMAVDG